MKENIKYKKIGLSADKLKVMALILMIIDHIGAILLPEYRILRYIGRLSFPIYCFLIAEGFSYTKNVYKYMLRLIILAVISEVCFDLAVYKVFFYPESQNVFFTLAAGLMALYFWEFFEETGKKFLGVSICMIIAYMFNTDYSYCGVLMIVCFYLLKNNICALSISIFLINYIYGMGGTGSQKYAVLAIPIIMLYTNEKKESGKVKKYFFYFSYPIHLLILYVIALKFNF